MNFEFGSVISEYCVFIIWKCDCGILTAIFLLGSVHGGDWLWFFNLEV